MATHKKSLISNLKTAKKAKVAAGPIAEVEGGSKKKAPGIRQLGKASPARAYGKPTAGAAYASMNFGKVTTE